MYYEDLGIYFHDNSYYSVENPVVRDELWQSRHSDNFDDHYDGDELRRYIRIEFNISGLSDDEKAENDADTGNREISGSANSLVYSNVLDILKAYGVTDITDFTEYE